MSWAWSLTNWASACRRTASYWRGSIVNSVWPAWTVCPSANPTFCSSPPMRALTATVEIGSTCPMARNDTGIVFATTVPAVTGTPVWGFAFWVPPHAPATRAAAATTDRMAGTPRGLMDRVSFITASPVVGVERRILIGWCLLS